MNPTAAEKLGIQPFDAAQYLRSDEDCALYLQACIEQAPDDAALFAKALGDIARARGMMQLARDTGITREGLYKALGEQGNPSLSTVLKVLRALGMRLHIDARPEHA
ncbi:addiction module antidote protein [Polaromonas hydrogenivorans]|uniref:Addiction module antidote protein n=1 Tax=Polaromonas hydrogenivorans TaxID=335476 RepID=A0AAU7LY19_9BURK